MFRISRKSSVPSTIDLTTVRDTLSYIHGDFKRSPALAKANEALALAIKEIDAVRVTTAAPIMGRITGSRFFPRKH